MVRVQVLVPGWPGFESQHLFPSCVILGKLFNLSVPHTSGIGSSLMRWVSLLSLIDKEMVL